MVKRKKSTEYTASVVAHFCKVHTSVNETIHKAIPTKASVSQYSEFEMANIQSCFLFMLLSNPLYSLNSVKIPRFSIAKE